MPGYGKMKKGGYGSMKPKTKTRKTTATRKSNTRKK